MLFAASLACGVMVQGQVRVSGSYNISSEVLDSGGGPAVAENYGNAGSIGPISGSASSANYGVDAGFLPQLGSPPAGPEIAVYAAAAASPVAERQSNSGAVVLPATAVGDSRQQAFTIHNAGSQDLTGLAVALTGSGAADFAVDALATTTLAPGATVSFTVTFTPTAAGARPAVLAIASADADENPFLITIRANDTLTATYADGTEVPLAAHGFTADGSTVNLALGYAPAVGTQLMIVNNTGRDFIAGHFDNLEQGQSVALSHGGETYRFVADYFGGSGNDLVLVWAATRSYGWGRGVDGQLGHGGTNPGFSPTLVTATGVLGGRTVLAYAAGAAHSLALCADGTIVAWGSNNAGQLGDGTTTSRLEPVIVPTSGTALAGKNVVAIAAGESHSLALCADGTVVGWGYNAGGQVGDGSTTTRLTPVAVATDGTALAGRKVVAIAAGRHHSLAVCADGTLAAWGLNFYGQLGDDSTTDRNLPVAVVTAGTPLAGKAVVAIAAGAHHNLALGSDNTLVAWGSNVNGQLGDGTGSQRNVPAAVITAVPALAGKTSVAIAAGSAHSLALCADGTIAAWGDNTHGQLGGGSSGQAMVPLAQAVSAQPGISALFGRSVTRIGAGAAHSLALCADGTIAAWGYNAGAQLGDNTLISRAWPVPVNAQALAGGERFVGVRSGGVAEHSLAVAASPPLPEISVFDGTSPAPNAERRSGVGIFAFPLAGMGTSSTPQTFTILNSGTAPLTGLNVTLAGAQPGDFSLGALGTTTLAPGSSTTFTVTFAPTGEGASSALVQVASSDLDENPFGVAVAGTSVAILAAYDSASDAAVTAAGYAATGRSVSFVLNFAPAPGTELMVVNNTAPAFITGRLANLAQGQTVSLTFGGETYDFVANYYGGSGNDLVLAWAGTQLHSWGQNDRGQLGDGSAASRSVPAGVAAGALAGKTIVALATGMSHSLALCADGTLAAWGGNDHGQLGDGTLVQRDVPIIVPTAGTVLAGKTIVGIAAGTNHSLALCADGTVAAWGANNAGQLGDGTNSPRAVPVAASSAPGSALHGKTAVGVAAGFVFSLALCSDGTVVSWGYNLDGQLGDGTGASSPVAVAVSTAGVLAGKSVVRLSASVNHVLALCSDGTLASWGFNYAGELGDSTTVSRYQPVAVTTASGALAGKTVVAIATGEHHSLALCSDGTVASWGSNTTGQLGFIGSSFPLPIPVTVAGTALAGKTAVTVAAGASHSLALCSDGTIVAWGKNHAGQLGDGSNNLRYQAVAVDAAGLSAGARFSRIASGSYSDHTLAVAALPPAAPELGVERPLNTTLANGGNQSFGSVAVGADTSLTFTIRNTGLADLTGLNVTVAGSDAAMFATTVAPATVVSGPTGTTSFTVRFAPTGVGYRSATLYLANNDPDENPFIIHLAGTALAAQEAWRLVHFGSTANSGNGADTADPDGDGVNNLVEYALGLDPGVTSADGLPVAATNGTEWTFTFTRPDATTELLYDVEVSTDLNTWTPSSATLVASAAGMETWRATYPLGSAATLFFRLKITAP